MLFLEKSLNYPLTHNSPAPISRKKYCRCRARASNTKKFVKNEQKTRAKFLNLNLSGSCFATAAAKSYKLDKLKGWQLWKKA